MVHCYNGASGSEGGAWGIAVLAAFLANRSPEPGLADHLSAEVFAATDLVAVEPDPIDVAGFDAFMQRHLAALPVQQAAVEHLTRNSGAG